MTVATPLDLALVCAAHLTPAQVQVVLSATLGHPGRYAALLTHRLGGVRLEGLALARAVLVVAHDVHRGGDA